MNRNKYAISSIILVGFLVSLYSACSKFQGIESFSKDGRLSTDNASSADSSSTPENSGNPSSPSPSPNSSNNPTPSPAPNSNPTPNPVPIPMPTPNSGSAFTWVHEPSGSNILTDCPFSGALCDGWQNIYKTQAYASFANAPVSRNSVFDVFLAANGQNGNGQWVYSFPSNTRKLYVGFVWSQNAEFQGNGTRFANKIIFVDGQGANFLNWVQYGGPDTPGVLTWVFQAKDGSNNCHIPGYSSPGCTRGPDWGPGTGSLPTNASSPKIAAGSGWHFIEILLQSSTTTTSQDGVVKIWIDGTLSTSHTNVNISPGGFEDFQINPTWDGTKAYYCYPAEPLGRDCSRSWHHYFDHVRISSK